MLLVCWMAAGIPSGLSAQNALLGEYAVKAAFLYNFAKFVEWPREAYPNNAAPIIICVLGEDPFGEVLNRTVLGKFAQSRPLVVKRSKTLENSLDCHILFISASERSSLPAMLKKVQGVSVLTVGETEGFAQRGGIINFTSVDNKVRFDVNNLTAKNGGLRISAKLLQLATNVWE